MSNRLEKFAKEFLIERKGGSGLSFTLWIGIQFVLQLLVVVWLRDSFIKTNHCLKYGQDRPIGEVEQRSQCVKQLGVAYEGVLKQGGAYLLVMNVFLRSGVEKHVQFWHDRWCGDLYFEEI